MALLLDLIILVIIGSIAYLSLNNFFDQTMVNKHVGLSRFGLLFFAVAVKLVTTSSSDTSDESKLAKILDGIDRLRDELADKTTELERVNTELAKKVIDFDSQGAELNELYEYVTGIEAENAELRGKNGKIYSDDTGSTKSETATIVQSRRAVNVGNVPRGD